MYFLKVYFLTALEGSPTEKMYFLKTLKGSPIERMYFLKAQEGSPADSRENVLPQWSFARHLKTHLFSDITMKTRAR